MSAVLTETQSPVLGGAPPLPAAGTLPPVPPMSPPMSPPVSPPMSLGRRIRVTAPPPGTEHILTPEALTFVARLDSVFAGRRCELLAARRERAERVAAGWTPDFNPLTAGVRDDPTWQVCPPAPGLVDRRVEITAPPGQGTAENALGSGAQVWLADLEDATSPTWTNVLQAQASLLRAVQAGPDATTIVVRPRGWHMVDKNMLVDGRPVSAAMLDVGLYLFHCAAAQVQRGSGPYLCLPKLEGHLEARLWNDVFVLAQQTLGIPRGTIRATVTVETIHAAFEMEEMLYELREHSAGLGADRSDYLASIIRAFAGRGSEFVLPDRSAVTMTAPFMRAVTSLLVDTCHRRGAHAIGGTSAAVPGGDGEANAVALERVRLDMQREADDGFDGSRLAHPGLVDTCRAVFDATLGDAPHQVGVRPSAGVRVTAHDLLAVSQTPGGVTEAGVRANVRVALRYVEAWLRGSGAVAIDGVMEDASSAEIARCQVWQWLRNGTASAEGTTVDQAMVTRMLDEEVAAAAADLGDGERLADARAVFEAVALGDELPPFLTTWAYSRHLL